MEYRSKTFTSRKELYEVCDKIEEIIRVYNFCSVSDIMDLTDDPKKKNRDETLKDKYYGIYNIDKLRRYCNDVDGIYYFVIKVLDIYDDHLLEKLENNNDLVNHPDHYISESGLEAIDVIKAFTSELEGYEAVATSQVLKYILRWKNKNGLEDLKKAKWYLEDLIKYVEEENN